MYDIGKESVPDKAKPTPTAIIIVALLMIIPTTIQSPITEELNSVVDFESTNQNRWNRFSGTDITDILANTGINVGTSPAGLIDNNGRYHLTWSSDCFDCTGNAVNSRLIYYALLDSQGEVLIAQTRIPTPTPPNLNSMTQSSSPIMTQDSRGLIHVVWNATSFSNTQTPKYGIWYTTLNPNNAQLDGSPSTPMEISAKGSRFATPIAFNGISNGTEINNCALCHSPDIAIDSNDVAHIIWQDTYSLNSSLSDGDNVYYTMIKLTQTNTSMNPILFTEETIIGQTLLDTDLRARAIKSPKIAISQDDTIAIAWGGGLGGYEAELVFPIDTSGSMGNDISDLCAIIDGGVLLTGTTIVNGLRSLLDQKGITIYDTLYALSGNWPAQTMTGNCQSQYQTAAGIQDEQVRTSPLGPGDTRGGFRALTDVVFNNATLNLPTDGGFYSEMWGPASNWACLSYRDSQGRTGLAADPPTTLDHRWNPSPTAIRMVLPMSDESPYGGDPIDSDDSISVNEAHDACLQAGITPIPIGAGFNNDINVLNFMENLAQCPITSGSSVYGPRSCDNTTISNTHAGGRTYAMSYTSGTGASSFCTTPSNCWYDFMHELASIIENKTTRYGISLTILDPYLFIEQNLSDWVIGDPAHKLNTTTNEYGEYLLSETESGLVIVDDTIIAENETATSVDLEYDNQGNLHLTWLGAKNHHTSTVIGEHRYGELNYMQIDLDRNGDLLGSINLEQTITTTPTTIISTNSSDRGLYYPTLDLDGENIHITWTEIEGNIRKTLNILTMKEPILTAEGLIPLGLNANELFQSISIKEIYSSTITQNFSYDFHHSSYFPITNYDWPEINILYAAPNCVPNQNTNYWRLCKYQEISDYEMHLEFQIDQPETIIITPGESTIVELNLVPTQIPNTFDSVNSSFSVPYGTLAGYSPGWAISIGMNYTQNQNASIKAGRTMPVYVYITAPDLSQVNENQSPEITITIRSQTYSHVHLNKSIPIHLVNYGDWDDDDADGIQDIFDRCPRGANDWTSSPSSDHDSDGCRDSDEDPNDDNDMHPDWNDNCPSGLTNWTSIGDPSLDYDEDGCHDFSEDIDVDNDGVLNENDICVYGELSPESTIDIDGDGCYDESEDNNDDNDPYLDWNDNCPQGALDWIDVSNLDYDSDGCHDYLEDPDDDEDGVPDIVDNCPFGAQGWQSSVATDFDGDGCQDSVEDLDLDNDGVNNLVDDCPTTTGSWISNSEGDWNGNGCRDVDEDLDDDSDGLEDQYDLCPRGDVFWQSNRINDVDADGCRDLTEDLDDDNDGVLDVEDNCQFSQVGWVSDPSTDYDGDGCQDTTEDTDDDNDGVDNSMDDCTKSELGWSSSPLTDWDGDGCNDEEDEDDDNDGIVDSNDLCVKGVINWASTKESDVDEDGCRDLDEDTSIQISIQEKLSNIISDQPILLTILFLSIIVFGVILSKQKQQTRRPQPKQKRKKSRDLDKMSYKDLQIIAKKEGIKANQKKEQLLENLKKNTRKKRKAKEKTKQRKMDPIYWLEKASKHEEKGEMEEAKKCRKKAKSLIKNN